MAPRYRSSIPTPARENVVETYPGGAKRKVEYLVRASVVGVRWFFESGGPALEYGVKNGRMHGMMYSWSRSGELIAAEPYVNGRSHGVARQWDEEGRLLGTYTMRQGTGVDLWWEEGGSHSRTVRLAEVHYMKDGNPHGFEWWLDGDGKAVYHERHWAEGKWHGIERMWNDRGRLRRGYPRYWLENERVSRGHYLRACGRDARLPKFRKADNLPRRNFPGEIKKALRPKRGG